MAPKTNREVVQRYVDALVARDLDASAEVCAADMVTEYPQSGERFRGLANIRAVAENYPGGLPKDLSGKVIGTQLGSSSQKAAEAFDAQLKAQGKPGYAELKTYERFPTAQQDLLARRLDAVVQGRPPLKVLIKERPGQFKILSGLGPKAYYGAVVRKGDTALLEYVNGQIHKLKQDGTLKALQEKWLGESDATLPDPWTPLS